MLKCRSVCRLADKAADDDEEDDPDVEPNVGLPDGDVSADDDEAEFRYAVDSVPVLP